MKYDKHARRSLGGLSLRSTEIFNKLVSAENDQITAIPELCTCLEVGPEFIAFSCLSGDQEKKALGDKLGSMFTDRKSRILQEVLDQSRITVIVDDTEPIRIWEWDTPQEEISGWCELVIEDSQIPENWNVKLWSEVERDSEVKYEDILSEIQKPEYSLAIHHRLEHMKEFPNKKLKWVRDLRHAATMRVTQYALQGIILEKRLPSAILIQSETPWAVKDPLYQTLRNSPLPIIHPFEERR